MTLLNVLDRLIAEHIPDFIEIGTMRYSKTLNPHKERRSLGVRTTEADFELIIWESGEAEFGYGTPEGPHEQQLVISDEADLRQLIRRLLHISRSWRPAGRRE